MIKVLALAGVVGTVALVATATGRIDELRSQLPDLRSPFNEVNAALKGAQDRERQWDNMVKQANSVCARHRRSRFVLEPTLPADGAPYVRAIRIELARARNIQSELLLLRPPANYAGPYSLFLRNRQEVLAALERLKSATRMRSHEEYADAARLVRQRKAFVDDYPATVGMPACAW
jgi:hypothetical protein